MGAAERMRDGFALEVGNEELGLYSGGTEVGS